MACQCQARVGVRTENAIRPRRPRANLAAALTSGLHGAGATAGCSITAVARAWTPAAALSSAAATSIAPTPVAREIRVG